MKKEKKRKKSTLIPKVFILLSLGFGINLFFSCRPYHRDPIEMNYNTISVLGIDNSERFLDYYNTTDTVYSEAVALKLTLSDSLIYYAASSFPKVKQMFTFQTLQADEIAPSYIPKNKVVDIQINTLLDINESLKAGDDISEHMLYTTGENFDLYYNSDKGISCLNGIQSYYEESFIILVLNTSIENTKAQFEVKVTLDNGNELVDTTNLFTIINS